MELFVVMVELLLEVMVGVMMTLWMIFGRLSGVVFGMIGGRVLCGEMGVLIGGIFGLRGMMGVMLIGVVVGLMW